MDRIEDRNRHNLRYKLIRGQYRKFRSLFLSRMLSYQTDKNLNVYLACLVPFKSYRDSISDYFLFTRIHTHVLLLTLTLSFSFFLPIISLTSFSFLAITFLHFIYEIYRLRRHYFIILPILKLSL
jgi:hypothetical protein